MHKRIFRIWEFLVLVTFRILGLGVQGFRPSWTQKLCKIMAFMAVILGLGPLFYILLGFRLGQIHGTLRDLSSWCKAICVGVRIYEFRDLKLAVDSGFP